MDANFAGTFNKADPENPRDCLFCTGYLIKFARCPLMWKSKLQTVIALLTTEAKYMALSATMQEVINLMNLMQEIKDFGIGIFIQKPVV